MPSCPGCDAEIEVDELDEFDVDLRDRLTCGACGALLEVVNVTPVELAAELDLSEIDDEDEGKDGRHPDGLSQKDLDGDDDWTG